MTAVRPRPATSTVPSCHSGAGGRPAGVDDPVVALAGAPNSGKSTLFNALTGARRTVGNWPGTTVEVGRGAWTAGPHTATDLIDLPGAYSLDPISPDEELTRDLIDSAEPPDLVVATVDAVHLARSLYLVAQLRERALRVVVALSMVDVAERRGVRVDVEMLSAALGVPVVALDPRRKTGGGALGQTVASVLDAPVPTARPVPAGTDELDVADDRFAWISSVVSAATARSGSRRRPVSDRVDRWVTAPVIGPLLFLAVMWAVFEVTTTVAAPLQNALDSFFTGPVTSAAGGLLGLVHLRHSWVDGFVVNGLIAGVGTLLTFLPLMTLMFLLLAVLEDSGYMARAAVVSDRLMRAIGLPGRAFLPLIVGFGCNVPAISATRILSDARHRLMTALLVPFTSCSARLTVYVLIATIFFPAHAGSVVFGMYVTSIVLVVLIGLAMRKTLWRTMGDEPLVLDLPPYQRPTVRLAWASMWVRVRGFLRTASGIIVATVSLLWVLQATPVRGGHGFGSVPIGDSLYAALSRAITPLFTWAGFADWHTTSALVVGFVAKEAVISSWAQTYATTEPSDAHHAAALGQFVHANFQHASGGALVPAVLAFLVFLLAYTPCVATLAAQRREIGLRWTGFGIALQLGVAWTLSVAVFQIGRLFV